MPHEAGAGKRDHGVPDARQALDGLITPDDRYLVVRGRLWRATHPALDEVDRTKWTHALMDARRAVGPARRLGDVAAERRARQLVHQAKMALGERGPVWWDDGAADLTRRLVANTPYAEWYQRAVQSADAIARLLDERSPDASVCPSEVARAAWPGRWRTKLDAVRDVARHLARHDRLTITQRGLYRIRYTGQPLHLPIAMKTRTSGLQLTFASPLDGSAARPEAFTVTVWDLKRTRDYGSERHNTRELRVDRVTLSDDCRTALLQVPDLAPTWVVEVAYDLHAADGTAFDGAVQGTIYALEGDPPAQ